MNFQIDVQAGFRKGKGTRDQIANIRWIMEKGREFQKNIYFCFDCVDHNKLWKILKEMGEFSPWVGKIPWRRAWQPTPVFLLGEPLGQRSLVGYSP